MKRIKTLAAFLFILAAAAGGNLFSMGDGAKAQSKQVKPAAGSAAAIKLSKYEEKKRVFNENTVMIITGQTSGTYLKMAEDLQNVLDNRETNELRVLPIVGAAGPQNIMDILFLRGIDMCMVETDYFDYLKALDKDLYGDIEKRVNYIAKLYNTEFHIVAGPNIKTLEDLRGKKVNFFIQLSSGDISGRNLFRLLNIDVEPVNFDQPVANEKLQRGEIAAVLRLAGAPMNNAFPNLKLADGFHFVPIDAESLGGFSGKFGAAMRVYLPTRLKAEDYPQLIPPGQTVPTLASSVVLASYAWPEGSDRYRRIAKFVQAFFDHFDKFKEKTRHPKWGQTNLATDVAGWTRFKAAQDWLDGKRAEQAQNAGASKSDALADEFEKFLRDYKKAGSVTSDLSDTQIRALRQQFVKWREQQTTGSAGEATPSTPAR